MDHNQAVFGVDVSSATLAIGMYGSESCHEIGNAPEPIAAWLAQLPRGSVVAMEATGRYHQMLAAMAQAVGMVVYVLNPQALKHYAEAIGLRAKTDRVDAQLIARYVAHERTKLRPWQAPAAHVQTLWELLSRRQRLVNARRALTQSLAGLNLIKAERETLLASFKRMIGNLELLIARELARYPELLALQRRLATIVGIGPIVSTALVIAFSRVPFTRAESFIAYSGLDPQAQDSGKHRGRRRLSKRGPALLRSLLYTAGMAASHSKLFRGLYANLIARGLQTTEAMVILGRKLARIAFALYRSGQDFDPKKHLSTP